jgi:PIN domain nuclease of toxin-antitoxin system
LELLLDTQVLIWAANTPGRLSNVARQALVEPQNILFVSLASIWELQLKVNLDKLHLGYTVEDFIAKQVQDLKIVLLPIKTQHIYYLPRLPFHKYHKDPFDRMLIAQAITEKMTIVSADEDIQQLYGINVLWYL